MATNVIMPALEMAQESGKLVRWLKPEGASVAKGEPIMEIETDKVTVEIESPASGMLASITAHEGDVVPVGQTIAWILAPGEVAPTTAPAIQSGRTLAKSTVIQASPVARKMAEEHGIDLAVVKPGGGRIEKADVLAYVEKQRRPSPAATRHVEQARLMPASPKARRLAAERGIDLGQVRGSGPGSAVLAVDLPAAPPASAETLPTVWRVMAERMSASWTTAPHFYLLREVKASRLMAWREQAQKRAAGKITFTDLLVKIVAAALRQHLRINSSWNAGGILRNDEINIGVAVAIDDGLIVPVIHRADTLTLAEIASQRSDLVTRAQAGRLLLQDIQGGTFTLSNLGMYGVDVFNAIVNPPQAAILAVGRIVERVVAVNGQPSVQPMLFLSLSCDHRVVDGARGARFLDAIAGLIEEPLGMLE